MEKPAPFANFFEYLCILLIYLKLTNQIDWSWWWVLAPIWIPAILVYLIIRRESNASKRNSGEGSHHRSE